MVSFDTSYCAPRYFRMSHDGHVMIGDALDRFARLVVQEERIALLGDVAGGLGMADENEAGRSLDRHAQGYMGSRAKCLRLTV